ncbi:MAG: hypothetical protein A2758_02775 [Candidatus Zambryskibacteria bacterium RIFCSPHIGHO2_01_FULL_49_18]|uniref:Peptidase S11 D-alanyl-D-alanine carboxypeptidase A N-terminal domain-containing protein n=2 Tax=Candidatus Zambryskiibacteriota TaxID=1817925 RepID=A0A1G2T2W9_9BACT|nr:MAG: hypothetical protein A2758_02775 [Candidatus Zambryskibacteria bacterium RIFCSPHIGHO2_01_FULL_49_18]OHB04999.1 MAG: hypothetical protein A3A26_00270 [Candidatus Zambryskibacteria bacterium RIFCSPLOWO2_01_FULL_47_14]
MIKEFLEKKELEIRFFVFLMAGLSLLMFLSYLAGSKMEREDNSAPSELVQNPFLKTELEAKAVYIYDIRTKSVLFAKNEDLRLPLASLTKIMSALVARELSPDYTVVTVGRGAVDAEGDSGLRPGERWRLKDLLDFSLISSSNDGIRAVALTLGALEKSEASEEEILESFVRSMNRKAGELDLKNTYFRNETGLDETEFKGGAYGTASDMAKLMEYILLYHPGVFEATSDLSLTLSSLDSYRHEAKNTNTLSGSIPGLIASKTGYTNTAGGNLAFIFDPELGRPIVVTILGSTENGRFADAMKLIKATLKHLNQ